MKYVVNCDVALRTSTFAIADSRSELSAIKAGLRETEQAVKQARACIAASFALKKKADRLLQETGRLFART